MESAGNNAAAFERMEEKVNRMLDEADAVGELNTSSADEDIDDLAAKYDSTGTTSAVDDELAALKAEMGM